MGLLYRTGRQHYVLTRKNGQHLPACGGRFLHAGTYYVVCTLATGNSGCGTTLCNAVTVYVNCPLTTNLIQNGTFSAGNTLFTSEYTYVTGTNSLQPEGTYTVGNNPRNYHGSFCDMTTDSQRSQQGYAGNSGGNMLIGNAATTGSKSLWKQTIAVKTQTDYVFTFWASSLASSASSLLFGVYAGCFRTGPDVAVVQANAGNCTWVKFTVQMSSGTNTSIDLAIRNISAVASGNDIAIDDLTFYECQPTSGYFPAADSYVWRGFSTDWFNTDNWGNSCVLPACTNEVSIPALASGKVYPIISATGAATGKLVVNNGASLKINAGYNLDLCGNLTNNGTLITTSTSTLTFSGSQNPQVLSGNLTGASRLGNLIVNKSNATDVLQVGKPSVLLGYLAITKGTLDGNGKTIRIAGNFTNSSIFSANSGTVEFNGIGSQQVTQTGTGSFYNLSLNKTTASGTLTFNPAVTTVSNLLTLTQGIAVLPSPNELSVTNSSPTAVTGYSASSYVNGVLRRAVSGTNTYDYPVGAINLYELLRMEIISNLGVSNVAGYFIGVIPSTGKGLSNTDQAGYDYALCQAGGYWDLTPNVTAAATARYKLTVFPTGFTCTGSNQTLIKRHDASAFWTFDNSTSVSSSSRSGFETFSEYTIATGNVAMPVKLFQFEGRLKENQAHLTWITLSEKNNDYFEIQRSADARHFEPIGRVKGAGTTREKIAYAFYDAHSLPGISYYRLRQVDWNGLADYSAVVSIQREEPAPSIQLTPNPIRRGEIAYLKVLSEKPQTYRIRIVNGQGLPLHQQQYSAETGENHLALDKTPLLPAGLYFVRVESTGTNGQTFKLVVE